MAWVSTAQDSFNRADAGDLGANWTTVAGGSFSGTGYSIVSNAAQPTNFVSDKLVFYSAASFVNDQYAQAAVTVTGTNAGTGPGVAVRSASDATCYRVTASKAVANNIEVSKFTPAFTSLGLRTVTWVDGDVLRIEVQGTTIRVYQNGVQLGADIIDSALTGGAAGVSYSSVATSGFLDNFDAGVASGGPGDDPPIGFLGRGAGW